MTTASSVAGQTPDTALPLAPGTWTVDTNHSGINFKIRHLGTQQCPREVRQVHFNAHSR